MGSMTNGRASYSTMMRSMAAAASSSESAATARIG
jgi:predicted secreted protein